MQKIREKYYKIFNLEGSQGYENRAVMGGLQALGKTWPSEAREQGVSESLIPVITMFFSRYPELEPENRRNVLLEIGDLLSIPNIKTLPAYVQTEKNVSSEQKPSMPVPQASTTSSTTKMVSQQPE